VNLSEYVLIVTPRSCATKSRMSSLELKR